MKGGWYIMLTKWYLMYFQKQYVKTHIIWKEQKNILIHVNENDITYYTWRYLETLD